MAEQALRASRSSLCSACLWMFLHLTGFQSLGIPAGGNCTVFWDVGSGVGVCLSLLLPPSLAKRFVVPGQ